MVSEAKQLARVRVFCASPGDVSDAREAVEEIIRQLDRIWRDRGVTLEFDGWEDTGPSAGRPQDEINELVDQCDIFVGLLNGRWGFPTGKYKSGFEEEYERALDRYGDEKAPELCVFFTELSSRDPQIRLVEEFRQRLQSTQEAYYRSFADLDKLRELVHRRVERYLNAFVKPWSAEAPTEVNWASVLSAGPVGYVADGAAREQQAAAEAGQDPAAAAKILEQLALDLVASNHELLPSAEQLLERAATLKYQAGEIEAAVSGLVSVLRTLVLNGSERARINVHLLGQWLPEDAQWVAAAWESTLRWPGNPEHTIVALRSALAHERHDLVTDEDCYIWKEQLVEILMWGGGAKEALVEMEGLPDLAADSVDVLVRLHCLAAEALDFAGEAVKADDRWDRLLAIVDDHGDSWPTVAAVVIARHAISLVRQERLAGAQRGFLKSAQRWSATRGAAGEVAEQYFNASVAANLLGEFPSRLGFDRSQAASLRSTTEAPERVAESLLHQGLEARLIGQPADALDRLTMAAQIHRRAGHLRGELHATRVLCELFEHAGEFAAALAAAVQCGERDLVLRLAPLVAPEHLPESVDLQGPSWVRRTSLVALGAAGRRLRPTDVSAVAPVVLEAMEADVTSMAERDRQVAAIEAASALVFEWPEGSRNDVLARLTDAAASPDFMQAKAAVQALMLRTNAAQGDHLDELVGIMLDSDSPGQAVSRQWVGGHLRRRSEVVRRLSEAATANNFAALEALAASEHVDHLDSSVITTIESRLLELLAARLGHTAEGHIIGFLRLEPWGSLAARVTDRALRGRFAEALMDFILNDSEPHANRASATNALHNLSPALTGGVATGLLDRLRPLAEGQFGSSVYDMPRELAEHPFNQFRMGDEAAADRLQAAALTASARLSATADTRTSWLVDAIDQALVSDEPVVVAGAWEAVWRFDSLDVPRALSVHLLHPADQVRIATLVCWRMRRQDAPPTRIAERLMRDDNVNVRLTLLALLRDGDRQPELVATMASDDPDAYVRASAAAPLRT